MRDPARRFSPSLPSRPSSVRCWPARSVRRRRGERSWSGVAAARRRLPRSPWSSRSGPFAHASRAGSSSARPACWRQRGSPCAHRLRRVQIGWSRPRPARSRAMTVDRSSPPRSASSCACVGGSPRSRPLMPLMKRTAARRVTPREDRPGGGTGRSASPWLSRRWSSSRPALTRRSVCSASATRSSCGHRSIDR